MIDIFRMRDGHEVVVYSVADDNAKVVGEIMGREEVNIDLTMDTPLAVRVGDYVRVGGAVYTLNREMAFEKRSDVEYRYDLVFESLLYRLLDKLLVHPLTGESSFSISRTLEEWVKLLVECVNTIDPGWTVSAGIPDTYPITMTFEGVSCREALSRFAKEFDKEFELFGKEIRFVDQIGNVTGLVFEQGKNKGLYTVTQEPVDTGNTITRVFPCGGTMNMMPGDGDVNGRLCLPEKYLENLSEYDKVVEKVVAFDDIYPRFKGSVDSVSGDYNRIIACEEINFNITDWLISGVSAKINFISGELMGESFGFTWDNAKKQITLVSHEDGTTQPDSTGKRPLIPHDLKKANAKNLFNLTDIRMPSSYKEDAIVELRKRASDYLAYYSRPRVKFVLEVDHRFLRGKYVLKAGDLVTVKIPETGMEKLLRINSVERNLKTGKISCTVSNYLDEKWEKKIEGELVHIRSSVSNDISEVRGEVSNVGRPSSLWFLNKQSEYLHLNDDGTITMLETGLGVKGDIRVTGDIIAYGGTTSIKQMYAVASPSMYGLVKVDGRTVKVNPDGQLYTDVSGLDETALGKYLDDKDYITGGYLTSNKYITQDYITNGKYISLSSLLGGYTKAPAYTPLSATDSVLSAFGKLDRRFDDYVDRNTNQTIGGTKTFSESLTSNKDVIAFGSSSSIEQVYALAEPTMYGLVKYDGVSIKRNASGQLYAEAGSGGIGGISISGAGNAVTDVILSADKKSLSFTKGLTFWHAGNDGSGSGLDADLLDGHQWTEIAGLNVASATKLQNARNINGTPFDGTAPITTNTWGTARNMSIASYDNTGMGTKVSVNGFSDYVLFLPSTIKATLNGNASSASTATKLTTVRKLWGQDFDGTAAVNGTLYNVNSIYMGNADAIYFSDTSNKNMEALQFSAANELLLGYGTGLNGRNTLLFGGSTIQFRFNNNGASTSSLFSFFNTGQLAIGHVSPAATIDVQTTRGSLLKMSTNYTGGIEQIYIQNTNINSLTRFVESSSSKTYYIQYGSGNNSIDDNSYTFSITSNGDKLLKDFRIRSLVGSFSHDITAGGNIKATGDVIAFGSSSSIEQVYALAEPTMYGLVKYDGVSIKRNASGQLYAEAGSGGIGGISISGSGNAISDVSLSADKKSLTFTKGFTFWHAGNDGAGSGLDADLLDGHQWSEIAGLSVASATRLQTARTLWGQSFDGTGNITGNLVSTGDVKGNTLTSTVANGTRPLNITSSTLCPNLNANYLEGYSSSMLAKHKAFSTTAMNGGYYKININSANGWMLTFTVRLYQTYGYYDIVFSGYNYGSSYWYSPNATLIGTSENVGVTVHFGYDSVWNLWVAVPAGHYTGMEICNIANGYQDAGNLSNIFSITNQGSLTGTIQTTRTIYTSSYKLNTARNIYGNMFDGTADLPSLIYLDGASANSNSHIRLVNSDSRRQWGIKAGYYMNNENDFTITNETNTTVPNIVSTPAGDFLAPRGSIYAGGGLQASNGLIYSILNGITSSFGAQNNGYCHITTTAPRFYFNNHLNVSGDVVPYEDGIRYLGTSTFKWGAIHGTEIYAYGWFRTKGDTGWYNEKWSGGINMSGPSWIDTYNKPFRSYNSLSVGSNGFNVCASFGHGNLSNAGIELASSDNVFGIGVHSNDNVYIWGTLTGSQDSSAGKAYMGQINLRNNQLDWFGALITTGDQVVSSDMRKKTYLRPLDMDLRSLMRVKSFYYSLKDDSLGNEEIGFSAQQLNNLCGCFVMETDDERLGRSYAVRYTKMGAILGVRIIQEVFPWMDEKDKKILELENRIKCLENKLAS